MKQRGRKSAAALEIAPLATAVLERVERQKPPHDLQDEEVEVWAAVVGAEPADWFSPSTVPILAQYCRHVVHARRVAELIEKATSDLHPETKQPSLTVSDYDRLLKMQERESRAIATLATKMRISQQATTNHRGNKAPKATRKPWEG
jgi:hypothetical protein